MAKLGHGCAEASQLGARELAEEMLLMGLRLSEGLDLSRLRGRTGYRLDAPGLSALQEEGLLQTEGNHVRATASGRLVLNAIIESLAGGLTADTGSN